MSVFISRLHDYVISIIFIVGFPLLPILFEIWILGELREDSVLILSALFAFSVGMSSRLKVIFTISVLAGIIYSTAYGASLVKEDVLYRSFDACRHAIGFFALTAVIERMVIHILDGEPFFQFK